MTMNNRFIWPIIDDDIRRAVLEQLDQSISIYDRSGIIKQFEDEFARYHSLFHALLCNSGTNALHSAYVAMSVQKGDEVLVPAYTFFATVTPLLWTGATPVLCDCDEFGNISIEEIKKKTNEKTKAVVVTHMWGIPCDMESIQAYCRTKRLLILEDCSHSHGATINGKKVGTFGDIAVWSLQGQKTVTGGEGGILCTNNSEFYYRAVLLGHYNKRAKQDIPPDHELAEYATTGMGLKYRAHPLAVAIAHRLFKDLDTILKTRDSYAERITKELGGCPIWQPIIPPAGRTSSWYAYIFKLRDDKKAGRERLCKDFIEAGLPDMDIPNSTSPLNLLPLFSRPEGLFPCYKGVFSYRKGDFPFAEKYYESIIKMPVPSYASESSLLDAYIQRIKEIVERYE